MEYERLLQLCLQGMLHTHVRAGLYRQAADQLSVTKPVFNSFLAAILTKYYHFSYPMKSNYKR